MRIKYVYDRRGRPIQVERHPYGIGGPQMTDGTRLSYRTTGFNDQAIALTESHTGGTLAGLNMQYGYDQYLRLTNVVAGNGANTLVQAGYGYDSAGQQFDYAFDDIGNRETTGGRASAVSTYTVDRRNQYGTRTVAAYADVLGIANPTANVTVNGNVASRKGEYFHHALSVPNGSAAYPAVVVSSAYAPGQSSTGRVYVAASPEGFTHDADGNLATDGRWSYTWDGENRLTQLLRNSDSPSGARQRLNFEYDHQGRRIMKAFCLWTNSAWLVVSSNKFLYDGWNLVAELNATNNALIRSYTWGSDLSGSLQGAGGVGGLLNVAYHVGTLTNGFVAYDGNGNAAGLVKASDGTVVARYDYGPFAEALRATGPMAAANPIRFSTKYQDGESGFLYYGYRYYNSTRGRWLSRDPIEEAGGQNIYGFCGNDSQNKVDVLGLWKSGGHTSLTRQAFERAFPGALKSFPCAETVLDRLTHWNLTQDDGVEFKQNFRHFNRDIDSPVGSQAARFIRLYSGYLGVEQRNFDRALSKKPVTNEDCEKALEAMGRLMHSWQDYYAHSIVLTRTGHDHTLWTAQPPITGSPENPGGTGGRIVPSSWNTWTSEENRGEHGGGEPDGAEGSARQQAAVVFTTPKLQANMARWAVKCACYCGGRF